MSISNHHTAARRGRRWRRQSIATVIAVPALVVACMLVTTGAANASAGASTRQAAHHHSVGVRNHSSLSFYRGSVYGHHTPRLNARQATPRAQALMTYHGGPVMLSTVTYAIYWEPSHLQNGASTSVASTYNSLLNRFFGDVGGHGLYTDMTQYYDTSSSVSHFIQNSSSFGGFYLDTKAYPTHNGSCGSQVNCVSQYQLQAEIQRVMALKGWTGGLTHSFFIYTSSGEDTCDSSGCAFATNNGWCGTHYSAPVSSSTLVYSVLPYDIPADCGNYEGGNYLPSPNNDRYADDEISVTSHEMFEAMTDPTGTGWYDNSGNEVGDKCDTSLTPLTWDSAKANQDWNGHFYVTQDEFDNHNAGCVQTGP